MGHTRQKKKRGRRTNAILPRPAPRREVAIVPLLPLSEGNYDEIKASVLEVHADKDVPGRCDRCGPTTLRREVSNGEVWEKCACNRVYSRGYLYCKVPNSLFQRLVGPYLDEILKATQPVVPNDLSDLRNSLLQMMGLPAALMR